MSVLHLDGRGRWGSSFMKRNHKVKTWWSTKHSSFVFQPHIRTYVFESSSSNFLFIGLRKSFSSSSSTFFRQNFFSKSPGWQIASSAAAPKWQRGSCKNLCRSRQLSFSLAVYLLNQYITHCSVRVGSRKRVKFCIFSLPRLFNSFSPPRLWWRQGFALPALPYRETTSICQILPQKTLIGKIIYHQRMASLT